MAKIFIYGVPGVGKTHFSKIIGKDKNLTIFEGDKIKNIAKRNNPDDPFLRLGTCQAYQQFGELNQENVLKGLFAVRQALTRYVEDFIKEKDDFVLEAAFLDPHILKKDGPVILITVSDETKHKKQFLTHREKLFDLHNNEFQSARIVQRYLIDEAKKLGVEIRDADDRL